MTAKYMQENSVEGGAEERQVSAPSYVALVDPKYVPQAEKIVDYFQSQLGDALVEMFTATISEMNGADEAEQVEKALRQTFEAIDGIKTKWLNRAESHRNSLIARLSKAEKKANS